MWYLKTVKDGKETLHEPADYIVKTMFADGSDIVTRGDATPGIRIELVSEARVAGGGTERKSRFVSLPEDGDVAYVMDHKGQTIDTYRWPPREEPTVQARLRMRTTGGAA